LFASVGLRWTKNLETDSTHVICAAIICPGSRLKSRNISPESKHESETWCKFPQERHISNPFKTRERMRIFESNKEEVTNYWGKLQNKYLHNCIVHLILFHY
jgi:hypothetical protein